ncbi:MAG: hypothetical protein ACRC10_03320 [Thermoguttaceae bacterium]
MSFNNPLTDPRLKEEELYAISQQQLLNSIIAEEEKVRRKTEERNVESRGDEEPGDSENS